MDIKPKPAVWNKAGELSTIHVKSYYQQWCQKIWRKPMEDDTAYSGTPWPKRALMSMTSSKSRFRAKSFSVAIRQITHQSSLNKDCSWLVQVQKITTLLITATDRSAAEQYRCLGTFPDTWCRSNAVQAKLKANFVIPLLETTAAVGKAAKLHKFIHQIVF